MYWIIAYFYVLDIIYIKDKISVTLLHLDISNKLFKICELLDEYEVIPIDQITSKILILDFNYKKKI